MAKSIKLKDETYIDSTGVVHEQELLNDILDIQTDFLKIVELKTIVTVGANTTVSAQVGAIPSIEGYTCLGVLPYVNGYGDQWIVSYAKYNGDYIYAMIHSKYSSSLTADIICRLIYIKTTYYDNNKQ